MQAVIRILHDYGLAETTVTRGILSFSMTLLGLLASCLIGGFACWTAVSYEVSEVLGSRMRGTYLGLLEYASLGARTLLAFLRSIELKEHKGEFIFILVWYLGTRTLGFVLEATQRWVRDFRGPNVRMADRMRDLEVLRGDREHFERLNREGTHNAMAQWGAWWLLVIFNLLLAVSIAGMLLLLANYYWGAFGEYVVQDEARQLFTDPNYDLYVSLFLALLLWPSIRYARLPTSFQVLLVALYCALLIFMGVGGGKTFGPDLIRFWQVEIESRPGDDSLLLVHQDRNMLTIYDRASQRVFDLVLESETRLDYKQQVSLSSALGQQGGQQSETD